jgi:hypothetical protein
LSWSPDHMHVVRESSVSEALQAELVTKSAAAELV